jgi:hypothetical protein
LRKPKPDEAAQAERCEQERMALQQRTVLVPAGHDGPFDDHTVEDEF